MKFPKDFIWGSATSAYQVEGGVENSDWSIDFSTCQSCDHYNRYEEDFTLLEELNQNAYRFSLEWSRIEPQKSCINELEIEHYRKVLQSLKSRNIKTMVTLHHFTTPYWIKWSDPSAVFYFSRFAKVVFKEYADLVDYWVVINEPLVYASQSYYKGIWTPQKKSLFSFLKVVNNQISACRKVYQDFHCLKQDVQVGIAKNNVFFEPYKSLLDKFSASMARYFWNDYFLNKVKNHLDFIGLNYYFHSKIKFPFSVQNENRIVSDIGWEIYPQGIYHVLKELKKYNLPIFITENGLADEKDRHRKEFIENHLYWVGKAIKQGVDVRGYFHWSLMDNFEWEKGFKPRFGLVEIDYRTLERRIRSSAYYYAKVCGSNQL
ncbi:glycoside hydrolase family 1 protein [Candidatus Parcubacteria bacterium]|nr:glycoside hydrolase family 1 protein [Candidatus Parcubacteria bacterium]